MNEELVQRLQHLHEDGGLVELNGIEAPDALDALDALGMLFGMLATNQLKHNLRWRNKQSDKKRKMMIIFHYYWNTIHSDYLNTDFSDKEKIFSKSTDHSKINA